jgi:aflatoxin B1 aldehyde reductase
VIHKDFGFKDDISLKALFNLLRAEGVENIDTAQFYRYSEELLGKLGAPSQFTIDMKAFGGLAPGGWSTREYIMDDAKESMRRLGVDKVRNFPCHDF